MRLTIRNIQIDDMSNTSMPVILGPRTPLRNIERILRKNNKEQENDDLQQTCLKFIQVQTVDVHGEQSTTTFEDLRFEMVPMECQITLLFLQKC